MSWAKARLILKASAPGAGQPWTHWATYPCCCKWLHTKQSEETVLVWDFQRFDLGLPNNNPSLCEGKGIGVLFKLSNLEMQSETKFRAEHPFIDDAAHPDAVVANLYHRQLDSIYHQGVPLRKLSLCKKFSHLVWGALVHSNPLSVREAWSWCRSSWPISIPVH